MQYMILILSLLFAILICDYNLCRTQAEIFHVSYKWRINGACEAEKNGKLVRMDSLFVQNGV